MNLMTFRAKVSLSINIGLSYSATKLSISYIQSEVAIRPLYFMMLISGKGSNHQQSE